MLPAYGNYRQDRSSSVFKEISIKAVLLIARPELIQKFTHSRAAKKIAGGYKKNLSVLVNTENLTRTGRFR
jgi:hypothetical protein